MPIALTPRVRGVHSELFHAVADLAGLVERYFVELRGQGPRAGVEIVSAARVKVKAAEYTESAECGGMRLA